MSEKPQPPKNGATDTPVPIYIVPKHGGGRLRIFQKGEIGNPTGQSGRYQQVVRMCRDMAPAVIAELVKIALDPQEDSRARIVASQEILGRAFGRIPAEVKVDAAGPALIDVKRLTDRELSLLLKLVESGRLGPETAE